jgi:hypothetical protein
MESGAKNSTPSKDVMTPFELQSKVRKTNTFELKRLSTKEKKLSIQESNTGANETGK